MFCSLTEIWPHPVPHHHDDMLCFSAVFRELVLFPATGENEQRDAANGGGNDSHGKMERALDTQSGMPSKLRAIRRTRFAKDVRHVPFPRLRCCIRQSRAGKLAFPFPFPMIRFLIPLLFVVSATLAAEPPISADVRAAMISAFEKTRTDADAALAKEPSSAEWLTRRGDARLFLGDAKGAVADFEKEITIEPSHDVQHWRLGIAYLFTGEFAKSAKQFEKYHAYDARDRENGVWQFLANARVIGIEKARAAMLGYTRFDREPFPVRLRNVRRRKRPARRCSPRWGKRASAKTRS